MVVTTSLVTTLMLRGTALSTSMSPSQSHALTGNLSPSHGKQMKRKRTTEAMDEFLAHLHHIRDHLEEKGKVPKYHKFNDGRKKEKYEEAKNNHSSKGMLEMARRAEEARLAKGEMRNALLGTEEDRKKAYQQLKDDRKAAYELRRQEQEAATQANLPYVGFHARTKDVMQNIRVGNLVFLVGPAGSGKTHMAQDVAKRLEKPFYFTGSVHQKHELLGFIDAMGKLTRTPFREAYEHGGMFLFDEYDASSPHAITPFNAALSNGQCAFPDHIVDQHSDFIAIAAGNTYGTGANRQYVGRFQQDAASLDRFVFIEIDYDKELEERLAHEAFVGQGGMPSKKGLVNKWVNDVRKIRRAINEMGLRHIVSPRASIMGSKLLAIGVSDTFMNESLIYKGMSIDQQEQIKAWMKEDLKGGKQSVENKKEILKGFSS